MTVFTARIHLNILQLPEIGQSVTTPNLYIKKVGHCLKKKAKRIAAISCKVWGDVCFRIVVGTFLTFSSRFSIMSLPRFMLAYEAFI